MITQSFDLNLIPDSSPVVVHCDQYDTGTGRLVISLYEGEMPYTPSGSATIQGSKPDGKGFSYSATLVGNVVTANLTEQMSCVAGRVRCQIVVTESTGRTGTFVFILDVQRSALPSDVDMSESEYEFIEQAIELTGQAVVDAQGYAEDAEESAEDSEAWAVGERGGVPVSPSDPTYENNAKYWASRAQGGVRYCGSIAFSSLPVTGMLDGDLYNITDDFTTDARFVEGAGITCKAGTNVAWRNDVSKWDLYFVGVIGDYVGLKGEIEINTSTSLNSLTTIGNYYKTDSTVAVTDYPSGYVAVTGTANFRLTVEKMGDGSTNDIKQTYVLINRIEYVFVRQYKSGSWGSWQRILTSSSNIGELSNVDSNSPSNGDYLGYNSSSSKYENMPVKGITIPADVNSGGTQYGANWLYYAGTAEVITPDTKQNYRVTDNGTTKLYYWTGSAYTELAGGGGVSGDYMGLYGMTEIQSSDGQGTTLLNLDQYTSVGNYYCDGKAYISTPHYLEIGLASTTTGTHYNAKFLLYVRKINNAWIMQDLYLVHSTNVKRVMHYQRHAEYANNAWTFDLWRADVDTGSISPDLSPYSLGNGMHNVHINNIADGDILTRVNGKWSNRPINKVTSLAVDLTGWTQDISSQSGTTLYKKQISLNHVYVESPTVDIGSSGVLPTVAEQESYNLLQYVTVDDSVPCLYLYASAIPTTAFYINVEGVD